MTRERRLEKMSECLVDAKQLYIKVFGRSIVVSDHAIPITCIATTLFEADLLHEGKVGYIGQE